MTQFTASDFFATSPSRLSQADIATAAAAHALTPAHLMAIADIEGSGAGFLPDNRPKILFEAKAFGDHTKHTYDGTHPQISSPTWNRALYRGGAAEYARLAEAQALDESAALSSASWGLFQIMGANFKAAGYDDVYSFVRDHVAGGEHRHLEALLTFLNSSGLIDELQRCDWSGFAKGYNGPGYAQNSYDQKLKAAFEKHGGKAAA